MAKVYITRVESYKRESRYANKGNFNWHMLPVKISSLYLVVTLHIKTKVLFQRFFTLILNMTFTFFPELCRITLIMAVNPDQNRFAVVFEDEADLDPQSPK